VRKQRTGGRAQITKEDGIGRKSRGTVMTREGANPSPPPPSWFLFRNVQKNTGDAAITTTYCVCFVSPFFLRAAKPLVFPPPEGRPPRGSRLRTLNSSHRTIPYRSLPPPTATYSLRLLILLPLSVLRGYCRGSRLRSRNRRAPEFHACDWSSLSSLCADAGAGTVSAEEARLAEEAERIRRRAEILAFYQVVRKPLPRPAPSQCWHESF